MMHSAEPVEVMAMKSMMIISTPPPGPIIIVAEAAVTGLDPSTSG